MAVYFFDFLKPRGAQPLSVLPGSWPRQGGPTEPSNAQSEDDPKDDFSSALTRTRASGGDADGTRRHQRSLHGLQLIPGLSYSFVSLRADFGLNIYASAEGESGRDRHKTPTRLSIIKKNRKKTLPTDYSHCSAGIPGGWERKVKMRSLSRC